MRKKLLFLGGFFLLTPLTFFLSINLILSSRPVNSPGSQVLGATFSSQSLHTGILLTNYTSRVQGVSGEPLLADARPVIIKNYLEKWKSPLAPYAGLIVSASDNWGVDPLLVVAIAQQESNLGRRVIANCFNAWGWAQTSTYTRCFDSWPEGIRDYTREFSENYIKKGLTTPVQIMSKYNPTSPDGSWAKGVSQFLGDLANSES